MGRTHTRPLTDSTVTSDIKTEPSPSRQVGMAMRRYSIALAQVLFRPKLHRVDIRLTRSYRNAQCIQCIVVFAPTLPHCR
jgi:hypothetical protein